MRKIIKYFFVATFCLLVSCGSEKQSNTKQIFRGNICKEPQTLDPRKARDINDIIVLNILFEGLFRLSNDNQVEKALCDSYEISEDGLKYTFTIKDAHWSNGDKVTSQDFAYSWKKILDPNFVTPQSTQLYMIKNAKDVKQKNKEVSTLGIYTPNIETLIVELEHPVPYFLKLLTYPVFFPINQKIDKKNSNWAIDKESYVNNGPFAIQDWKHHDQLILNKNNKYWDKEKVKLEQINLIIVSQETEFNMFENNELDWAGSPFSSIQLDSLDTFAKSENFYTGEFLGTCFLRINTQKIEDKNFRQDLSNAIERSQIAEYAFHNIRTPTHFLVPTKKENIVLKPVIKKDVGEHQIVITYTNLYSNNLLAQALQRNWEDNLKITVKLEAIDRKTFFDRIFSGKYEVAISSWIADFNDPINFLEVFKNKDNGTNNTFWENNEYISLLDESTRCLDQTKRLELLKKAEEILLEEVPIIPIYYLRLYYLKNNHVKDLYISNLGIMDFKRAYID